MVFFTRISFYNVHLLHQVSDGVPVLHGGCVVQVALDGEALVIENHHTNNIRRILTLQINHAHDTSLMLDNQIITVILLMMSDISSLHSTMLLLDTVLLASDIRLLELLFLEAILNDKTLTSMLERSVIKLKLNCATEKPSVVK